MAEGLEDIYSKITNLQAQLDAYRPLPQDVEGKIMQKFRLDWNYHSNAIEGNKLTYGETIAFLMEGLTAKGKPLKDHLDIQGHNRAIALTMDMVKQTRPLNESDIRGLHEIILVESYESDARTAEGIPTKKRISLGKYKEMPNHVKTVTGEIHYYATPEETPAKMQELVEWYNEANTSHKFHPLELAARFHHRFTAIHPFDDGNGRLGRILMNLILLQHQLPPIIVKQEDRSNYYSVLNQADKGIYEPLIEYLGNLLIHSLEIYLRGAKGESIEEPSDLDKEIALLIGSYEKEDRIKIKKDNQIVADILSRSILPLIINLTSKSSDLIKLFDNNKEAIIYDIKGSQFTREPNGLYADAMSQLNNSNYSNLNNLSKVFYTSSWQAFKKSEEPFSFFMSIEISFENYKYRITYGQSAYTGEIKKFYHEQLTPNEIDIIITASLRNAIDFIKTHSGKK